MYPNKNIVIPVDTEKMSKNNLHILTFAVSYKCLYKNKIQKERIIINYDQFRSGVFIGAPRKSTDKANKKLEDDVRRCKNYF